MPVGGGEPFGVGLGGVLGHRVGGRAQHGEQPGRRRGHHEAAAAALQPGRQQLTRRPHVGHQVDLPGLLPGLLRRVRAGADRDAGVGAVDVDLVQVLPGGVDEVVHALLGRHVAGRRVTADLLGHRRGGLDVQVVDHHPGTRRRQPAGQRPPDPRTRAGDDDPGSRDFYGHARRLS